MNVINLFAGPGAGKSTNAAGLFYRMKMMNLKVELVTEYAKDKVYEGALGCLSDQIYIFGKQQFQLFTMKDEVEVIVTDSPIILSSIYDKTKCPHLKALILKEFRTYNNFTYFIDRDEDVEYEQEGRYQDLDGAKKVDKMVKKFMDENKIKYKTIKGVGKKSVKTILADIKKEIGK